MDHDDVELYAKYRDELIRFASALVGPAGAEDAMTRGVLAAMGSAAWPTVAARRAYLYRAVLTAAQQEHRATQRRLRREASVADRDTTTDGAIRAEVLDAIRRLSVRQRAVVFLTYWHDLAPDDIARRLELSRRTVERELTNARRRLEVLLRD